MSKICKNCDYLDTDQDREEIIMRLTGHRSDHCDLCGDKVTGKKLSTWDEDGHVYCNSHGPIAKRAYCDDHVHLYREPAQLNEGA